MKQLVVILLLIAQVSFSQERDTMDIFQCFDALESHYPRAGEKVLIDKQTSLEIENLKAQWYPNLNMNAQATYQSDIVKIDVDLPFNTDFPSPSRDQYKATLDVNQMIYDGGTVNQSYEMELIGEEMEKQSVESELYQVKDQVIQVYFGIKLLQTQRAILKAAFQDLQAKIRTVSAAVDNGTLLPSDLKNLQAEELHFEQNLEDLKNHVLASYGVLNEITGLEADTSAWLKMPGISIKAEEEYQRPEHEFFRIQKQQLDARENLLEAQKRPKVHAFGQFGYGKPGLNFLNDEFDTFYMIGARFTWNIWDWNQNTRKQQVTQVQKQRVDITEKTFNKGLTIRLEKIEAEISSYEKTIERDSAIIRLRGEVLQSTKAKLGNGVITSSEYISNLKELTKAKITHQQHQIELLKAKLNYLFTVGKI